MTRRVLPRRRIPFRIGPAGRRPRARVVATVALGLLAALTAGPPQASPAQEASTELGWVGLFNRSIVGWLENENRLEELCRPFEGSTSWDRCRVEMREPKVLVIPVRAAPRRDAPALGRVVVTATPGQALRAHAARAGDARPFVPDLFDADWGYGPYFHQTIRSRQGSWYQVPIDDVSDSGWIDTGEWTDAPDVVLVDGIISTPRGSMVVLGRGGGVLRVRPEQPADMWCEAGEPPALESWEEIRMPVDELFDARGHLLVHVRYTRGC